MTKTLMPGIYSYMGCIYRGNYCIRINAYIDSFRGVMLTWHYFIYFTAAQGPLNASPGRVPRNAVNSYINDISAAPRLCLPLELLRRKLLNTMAPALTEDVAVAVTEIPTKTLPKSSTASSSEKRHEEYQYLDLVREILETGEHRPDR
jgi:hypothetical protein